MSVFEADETEAAFSRRAQQRGICSLAGETQIACDASSCGTDKAATDALWHDLKVSDAMLLGYVLLQTATARCHVPAVKRYEQALGPVTQRGGRGSMKRYVQSGG